MKIIITGKHLEIGDSLKTHIEEATNKVVTRFFGDILEAHVNLSKLNTSKDNFIFSSDLSFHISRHFIIRSHAEDHDAYRSFNLAMEKLEARINRYRSRLRNRKRHHDLKADIDYIAAQQYVINGVAEENVEKETPLIIAEMDAEIPTASVSDAVMQMDLTEQPLVMFKNASSGRFNVVYRRPDGNIGWIDPEKAVH
jgi:ribosomal subunit interface protein